MPIAILETPSCPPPPSPKRKVWTREECKRLAEAGLLDYHRLELIEGELIDTMGKLRPHSCSILLLRNWLLQVFGPLFVQDEIPIDVAPGDNPISEPEPDLAVTARPFTDYVDGNPPPADVRLVVEVSNTTLAFDRSVKARLYARAEIAEFWIVDVPGRRILVHRDPREGVYRSVVAYAEGETISPLAAPDSPLEVRQALPPASA